MNHRLRSIFFSGVYQFWTNGYGQSQRKSDYRFSSVRVYAYIFRYNGHGRFSRGFPAYPPIDGLPVVWQIFWQFDFVCIF